jgi:hypothetical protein
MKGKPWGSNQIETIYICDGRGETNEKNGEWTCDRSSHLRKLLSSTTECGNDYFKRTSMWIWLNIGGWD